MVAGVVNSMRMRGDLDADALARACAAAMLARDRAAQGLGITILECRAGYARLGMRVDDAAINGHGIAHGGVVFTLADTAFAFACNSRNVPFVALDANISFAAPARLHDELEATAQERSLGGRTGIYDVDIRTAAGELIALFHGTCYRIRGSVLDGADG